MRYSDGYEETLETTYIYEYSPETGFSIPTVSYAPLDMKAEIARKYPGELKLKDEYDAKNEILSKERDLLYEEIVQSILADTLNSSELVEEQVYYLWNTAIDKRCRNVDENAEESVRFKQIDMAEFDFHYGEYVFAKKGYEAGVEEVAFLKGERPLKEADYQKVKRAFYHDILEKVIRDPNDTHYHYQSSGAPGIQLAYIKDYMEKDYEVLDVGMDSDVFGLGAGCDCGCPDGVCPSYDVGCDPDNYCDANCSLDRSTRPR